jgi:hypothetical protein
MPLDNLRKKINALQVFDIEKDTIDIINKNEYYITALLKLQLQEGKDSEGKNVTIFGRDYYSDRTIFDKEHGNYPPLGKLTQWITNYKTGAFYASLITVAQGRVFKTESDVAYFDKIIQRSGDKIMKLNKQHLVEFAEEILVPELRKRFKDLSNGVS